MPFVLLLEFLIEVLGTQRAYALCVFIINAIPRMTPWMQALLDPTPGINPISSVATTSRVIRSGADVFTQSTGTAAQSNLARSVQYATQATIPVAGIGVTKIPNAKWKELAILLNREGVSGLNRAFPQAVLRRDIRNLVDVSQFASRTEIQEIWLGPAVGRILEQKNWFLIKDGASWVVFSRKSMSRHLVPDRVRNAQQFQQWLNNEGTRLI